MIEILCSVNQNVINKLPQPAKDLTEDEKQEHHKRNAIKMRGPWENIELSPEELMEVITVGGWAISAQGTDASSRTLDNFLKTNLIMIDIDNTVKDPVTKKNVIATGEEYNTLEQALDNPFYKGYGFGYYISPSFKPEHHKYRLLFVSDLPLQRSKDVTALRYVLNSMFNGDNATTDGVRLFFSNNNNHFTGTNTPAFGLNNKVINVQDTITLCDEGEKMLPTQAPINTNTNYVSPGNFEKKYIITKLAGLGVNNHEEWIKIGAAMANNGFTKEDFVYVTVNGLMSSKSQVVASAKWDDLKRRGYNKITMGTIWHYIGGHKLYNDYLDSYIKQKAPKPPVAESPKEPYIKPVSKRKFKGESYIPQVAPKMFEEIKEKPITVKLRKLIKSIEESRL